MNKKKGIARTLAAFAAAGLLSCAMASVAFADATPIPVSTQLTPGATTGSVQQSQDSGSGATCVNVLDFTGDRGDMVFLSVKIGDQEVAKYLPHELGTGEGSSAGKLSADAFALELEPNQLEAAVAAGIEVSVYDSRGATTPTSTYTVSPVYAILDGVEDPVLIGTCTQGAKFNAPEKLQVKETAYALEGEAGTNEYAYKPYIPASSVDGAIRYTDVKTGNQLSYYTTIAGLTEGESRTMSIPTDFSCDGKRYRTLAFVDSVTATYPSEISFTIPVVAMGDLVDSEAYTAAIALKAGDITIATDAVNVKDPVQYTAPLTIYKTVGDKVLTYTLKSEPSVLLGFGDNKALFTEFEYELQAETPATIDVVYNLLDGRERNNAASAEKRHLGTKTVTVSADNPSATPDGTITVNGTKYTLAGTPDMYEYTYGSQKAPVIDAYYVPENYQADEPYQVTVNYVNYFDRSVIDSETFESEPTATTDMVFVGPEQFEKGGVTYVRLAGQEEGVSHNYFSRNNTYTVYYRDANQKLEQAPTITTVRTVYQTEVTTAGNATTTTTGGTARAGAATTAGAGASAGAATTTGAATSTQLRQDQNYTVTEGAGTNQIATAQDGRTAVEERIEDDAVAMSDGLGGSSADDQQQGFPIWVIPIAIAVLVAIGGGVFYFTSRRGNGTRE